LIAWDDAGEATRNEFRRRAMRLMLFDGSLLSGVDPAGEDYGLAELQALEAEAWAVIRHEVGPGDIWSASSAGLSGNGVFVADGDDGADVTRKSLLRVLQRTNPLDQQCGRCQPADRSANDQQD